MYFVSALGRTKLPHEYVEQIEQAVRNKLEESTKEINQAIDGAELLFKNHSIEIAATYDTVAMEVEVGITSALGRRYFELIHKLDQLMPLLQTLEIEEVITEKQVEQQRSRFKRLVLAMSSTTRNFAMGCRRRMNEVDAKKDDSDTTRARAGDEKSGANHVNESANEAHSLTAPQEPVGNERQEAAMEPAAPELS